MLSIFCSTEFSFKTPQNWAFFIWTFSLFFPPHLSFNKPDLMFLFIVGRAGDLFSLLFFLIYYLFSFYFVLCVFQLFPLWNSFVHRWSWSQGSTLLRKKKKKKMWRFLFTRGSKWNESTSLSLLQQLWKVIPKHLGHQLNWSLSSGRLPWPDEPAVQPQPHPPKHSRSPNVSNSEHSALLFKRKTLKIINGLTLLIITCVSTDLWAERLWGLQHVEQLWVVDLQQHACDLACQAGVHVLDQWKQTLTYWRDT